MSIVTPGQSEAANRTAHGVMSYEDFLVAPHENQHVEWVDGKVVPMAPISNEHTDITGFLLTILRVFSEAHNVGRVLYEPFQMKTDPNLPGRSPDLLVLKTENFSRLKKNHLIGPADLVVEVISPGSRSRDRGEKYYEYEQGGVPEYWLIDPERKQAEFYARGSDNFYHAIPPTSDGIFQSAVLPNLWIKVDWLWNRPNQLDVLRAWKIV